MSLARAFTTRRKQPSHDASLLPQRSNTTKATVRSKISGPMALTHTTNMLAFNAPDLYPRSESSPTESSKSDDDYSDSPRTSASSPPTSPDVPSAHGRPTTPEPNHLSCYFVAPGNKSPTSNPEEAPSIPKRAPSHTKKASYDNLVNKFSRLSNQSVKSISTKASFTLSRSSSTSTTATSVSSGTFSRKPSVNSTPAVPTVTSPPPVRPGFRRQVEYPESQHPFGNELAQVTELAEELGVREKMQAIDEEEQALLSQGLCRFRPEDYLAEVHGLFSTFFRPERPDLEPLWI
ncbi:hypothetical protein GGS23DRAFT_271827 [Durotheca rogersii]|uniref:uncharacterized protein n=1 Tax=Durotheca rogersii TaxID=419775 RepID=UPI00221EE500|nr:uncharacterized protein GGS23DRAFT_271827 [Durotheca rogersii]KAI5866441.1 hypothetical protein GGS23DRAFT_271827 [Durotheca rogersii]